MKLILAHLQLYIHLLYYILPHLPVSAYAAKTYFTLCDKLTDVLKTLGGYHIVVTIKQNAKHGKN